MDPQEYVAFALIAGILCMSAVGGARFTGEAVGIAHPAIIKGSLLVAGTAFIGAAVLWWKAPREEINATNFSLGDHAKLLGQSLLFFLLTAFAAFVVGGLALLWLAWLLGQRF